MTWKMVDLEERLDRDRVRGIYKYKMAKFTVNGTPHTLRISMTDFEADKTTQLVEREVQKILAVLEGTGSGGKVK